MCDFNEIMGLNLEPSGKKTAEDRHDADEHEIQRLVDEILDSGEMRVPRGRGRPTRIESEALRRAKKQREEADRTRVLENPEELAACRAAVSGVTKIPEREFFMPVTKNFLARVLNMDPMTVDRRLRRVKPIYQSPGSQHRTVYDFATAIQHIVTSKMDRETFLATLNPHDLPPSVNKAIWEGKRQKLKYEYEAGQAWATEDVLSVFGTVFMSIKDRTKLWADDLREQCKGMTAEEVLGALQQHVDAYLEKLHAELVEIPAQYHTPSKLAESDDPIENMEE